MLTNLWKNYIYEVGSLAPGEDSRGEAQTQVAQTSKVKRVC